MSEITRERILAIRNGAPSVTEGEIVAICDAALRAIDSAKRVKELEEEKNVLQENLIPFVGIHATQWAANNGKPNHLHPQHYDLLLKCGARMDSFTRLPLSALPTGGET